MPRAPIAWIVCLVAAPGVAVELFPVGDPYPRSLADPHAPANAVRVVRLTDVEIEDAGELRFLLQTGGRFPVLGGDRGLAGGELWRLSIEAGLDGVFDIEENYDSIAWDGNYGLIATAGLGRGAVKFGALHTSGHLGDEYAERTGRRRLDYTREEILAAMSWPLPRGLRVYGETGWARDLRDETIQAPWRGQAGLEWQSGPRWGGRVGLYGALDLQAMEERDWELEASLQLGWIITSGDRRWRVGVEYLDGRPPIGQFYQLRERGVGIGLWLDL